MAHFWRLKQSFDPRKDLRPTRIVLLKVLSRAVASVRYRTHRAAGTVISPRYYASLHRKVSHRSLIYGKVHAAAAVIGGWDSASGPSGAVRRRYAAASCGCQRSRRKTTVLDSNFSP